MLSMEFAETSRMHRGRTMAENSAKVQRGMELFTTADLCRLSGVTSRTVRRWVRDEIIHPKYRVIGGNAIQAVFLPAEVERFMNVYLVDPGEWGESEPKAKSKRM